VSFHSPREAERIFKQAIQRAVKCLQRDVVVVSTAERNGITTLAPVNGDPLRLRTRVGESLFLSFAFRYETVRIPNSSRHRIAVREYIYTLTDAADTDILAYHWHPVDRRGNAHAAPYPHMHIYGATSVRQELGSAHLVSGRVSLEEVLACLISSFNVVPANGNWEAIFRENIERFIRDRSWPGGEGPQYRII
jgi:hypothetical protein